MSDDPDAAGPDLPIPIEIDTGTDRGRFGRPARRMPAGVYRADRGHVETVRWLAGVLGLLVLLAGLPALGHLNVASAPGWARALLLITLLQIAYLAWMAILPDWSTVWVAMLVFAAVATLYALAAGLAVATPPDRALPLGLGEVRDKLARWSTAALLLGVLGTYLCGRTSVRWQRSCRRWSQSSPAAAADLPQSRGGR